MRFLKSRYERQLDSLMMKIDTNMSNNYKDNAQADLRELEAVFKQYCEQGVLKEKTRIFYEKQLGSYREKLKGYTHKDQKPYWT